MLLLVQDFCNSSVFTNLLLFSNFSSLRALVVYFVHDTKYKPVTSLLSVRSKTLGHVNQMLYKFGESESMEEEKSQQLFCLSML